MDFATLTSRLASLIQGKIKGGEYTERGLARIAGISQPHMHHIVNGKRCLTPATADRLLRALGVNLQELIVESGGVAIPMREIPMLNDTIGPGKAWPIAQSVRETVTLPAAVIAGLYKPVAARVAFDPRMAHVLRDGELVVLDCKESAVEQPDPRQLYVVDWRGEGLIRWVRLGSTRLYVAAQDVVDQPLMWQSANLGGKSPREFVKARVLAVPNPRDSRSHGLPLRRPPGMSPGLARRSVAN